MRICKWCKKDILLHATLIGETPYHNECYKIRENSSPNKTVGVQRVGEDDPQGD